MANFDVAQRQLDNSKLNEDELLRKLVIPDSPYKQLFKDGLCEEQHEGNHRGGCVVEEEDETDDEEKEADWEEGSGDEGEGVRQEGGGVREDGGGVTKNRATLSNDKLVLCGHCKRRVENPKEAVQCPKCHSRWETFCSSECLGRGEKQHADKCLTRCKLQALGPLVSREYQEQEEFHGRHFGCVDDLPGIEHEFLGGSKISLVLKIGRTVSVPDCVFRCQDSDGQHIKVRFQGVTSDTIQGMKQPHVQLCVPIFKAFLQPLYPSNDEAHTELGIIVQWQNIPSLYLVSNSSGEEDDISFQTILNIDHLADVFNLLSSLQLMGIGNAT